jgi:SEC-C motif
MPLRDFSDGEQPDAAPETVARSEGTTPSEHYLKKLCDRSFLSLWSYPGVFRDQGRTNGKGDGKEVADLLVVFENHIIIFSDKHIRFATTDKIESGWARWFKKAVLKSAQQVWGAERWIRQFPNRLFLDRHCKTPFPIEVPDPAKATFHRIVVAHDASRVCRAHFGGSGSLMIDSRIIGEKHHLEHPFVIGRLHADRGYIHVFDDTSLDVVMGYLDTVSDFVAYLTKKEKLLTENLHVRAAGEEELLGEYVRQLNKDGDHDFVIPERVTNVLFPEGLWAKFLQSDERKAQETANQISYSWDLMTEKFLHHIMSGTQYECSHPKISVQEKLFRWLARENRTRRRMLAKALLGLLEKTPADYRASRIVQPSRPGDPYFVFLLLPYYRGLTEAEYREARGKLLREYLLVLKLHYPDAKHIVGIATETLARRDYRSEDFLYLDATEWTAELDQAARASKVELGIFTNVKIFAGREQEYPVDEANAVRAPVSRNSPCTCGSGKRFKRCHGAGMFSKKKGKLFRKES